VVRIRLEVGRGVTVGQQVLYEFEQRGDAHAARLSRPPNHRYGDIPYSDP
jgi:predicted aconitase with swiveling domain